MSESGLLVSFESNAVSDPGVWLDAVADAVFMVAAGGRVLTANRAFERLIGRRPSAETPAEAPTENFDTIGRLLPGEVVAHVEDVWLESTVSRERAIRHVVFQGRVRRLTGDPVWSGNRLEGVLCTLSELPDTGREVAVNEGTSPSALPASPDAEAVSHGDAVADGAQLEEILIWVQELGESLQAINKGVLRLLGFEEAVMLAAAEGMAAFVHPDDRLRFRHSLAAAVRLGESQVVEHGMLTVTGGALWCRTTLRPLEKETVRGVTVPLGPRQETPTSPERCNDALLHVARLAGSAETLEGFLDEALACLCAALDTDAAELVAAEGNERRVLAGRATSGMHRPAYGFLPSGFVEQALRTEGVLASDDLESDRRFTSLDVKTGTNVMFRSVYAAPLLGHGGRAGTLFVYACRPAAFSQEGLRFLGELQGIVALVLENFGLRRRLRSAESRLSLRDALVDFEAHELKNPLAAMQLQVQVGKRIAAGKEGGISVDRLRRHYGLVEKQVRRLTSSITETLEFWRHFHGRFQLSLSTVEMSPFLKGIVDNLTQEAADARCDLNVETEMLPVMRVDQERLRFLIERLLTLGFKYGSGKQLDFRCRDEGGRLVMRLHAPGVAFPDTAETDLTQALQQRRAADIATTLFLGRLITEAHGGTLDLTHLPREGTAFVLNLPITGMESTQGQAGL